MNTTKKNILFLASWFPTRIIPTLGNFIQRHAESIATSHNVTVLVVQHDPSCSELQLQDDIENGVRIVRVYFPKNGFIAKFLAFQKGWKHLQSTPSLHFDLVQLNVIWKEGWQAVYLKMRYRIPFVICEHWTGYHTSLRGELPKTSILYMKWVAKHASAILPVSEKLGLAMQQLGLKNQYFVVPNVVDLDVFKVGRPKEGLKKFLHISHLDNAHKNIKGILSSWKKATEIQPDLLLHLGGDGDLTEAKRWANELEIPPKTISFFNTLTPTQVAQLMSECDALILFSNYENLPLVIIEGMATGLQIIGSDVGGVNELIGNDPFHFLIPRKNEEALINSIKSVKHLTQEEMNAIRTKVLDKYSIAAVEKKFNDVYATILDKQ